jgi:hypothetical protein
VLWLCVSIAVSTLEYCPVLLLLLNVLLFLASIGLLSVCALVVPLTCVSDPVLDYLRAELLHWFCVLSFRVIKGGACFSVFLYFCVALMGLCLLFQ